MSKKQQKFDDDQFQVILSRQDYEHLKQCRDDYQKIKVQFQANSKQLQSQRNSILQKYEHSVLQNKQLEKEQLEIEQLVMRINKNLKDRQSQVYSLLKIQLLPLKDKKQEKPNSAKEESNRFQDKLKAYISQINEIYDVLALAFEKEIQKTGNLIKQTAELKQENFRLNVQISQNNDRLKSLSQQNKTISQSKQRQRLEIEQLKEQIKQLQQAYRLQSTQNTKKQSQLSQQIQSLKKNLTTQQNENKSLQKQILLVQQQNIQFRKQNNDFQDEINEYQQHISMLKQSIQLSSRQKEQTKKSLVKSKFEKEDYIKEALVEYMREIRKNLISIGNLSQEQIRQIGTSELRTLSKFIQELQEDFQ